MKVPVPQFLRPFFPFILEEDSPQQIILKNESNVKIHVYFLLAFAFAESLLTIRDPSPIQFSAIIIFLSGSIIMFFANEPEEILVSPSGITLTRKFLFFSFRRYLLKEDIHSIKYSMNIEDIDNSSGYIIINRFKGRSCKIIHLRRVRNQISEDLIAIRDRFSKILSISTDVKEKNE